MPAPRAMDWDLLRDLVEKDPTITDYELLVTINADNARNGRPPTTESTIRTVFRRNRAAWGLPPRQGRHNGIAPPDGTLATEHKMDTPMRYVRDLAAAKEGQEPTSESGIGLRAQSTAWAEKMRRARTVVDLTADGRPIVREARAEELNSKGELISLAAWRVPGWRDPDPL